MSSKPTVPYKDSQENKAQQIEKMFDNISGNYDFLNRVITFGMDKGWRRKVLEILNRKKPDNILDIATGTGDMAILFAESSATKITGVDISRGMLDVAERKIQELHLEDKVSVQTGTAEDLKFGDNTFDAVNVTYGIRNFENLEKGLTEIYRVLKPGGVLTILETSVPHNVLIRSGYMFYTKSVMPKVARMFSKDKDAYAYLSDSAVHFPHGEALKTILQKCGFHHVQVLPQFFGASTIYVGEKSI